MEATITNHLTQLGLEDNKTFTIYIIQCKLNNIEWEVTRRYREFDQFNKQIQQTLPASTLQTVAKFPPKIVVGNMKLTKIQQRMALLQEWISSIIASKEVFQMSSFHEFFDIKLHVPLILNDDHKDI